jgi:hypothetical protein
MVAEALLALLIGDSTGSFARGLAGSLAFAAAAVLCAFPQVPGFYGHNSFHFYLPRSLSSYYG